MKIRMPVSIERGRERPCATRRGLRRWKFPLSGAVLALGLLSAAAGAAAADLDLPLLWTAELHTLLESAATVADINGDGRAEILAAGREELFALNGAGAELWRWRTPARFMTYPAILIRPDGTALVYAADDGGRFTCLDGNGREVWHASLNGPSSWSASVVSDLDGDGRAEVVQPDDTGTVWTFDALTGDVMWQTAVKGNAVSPAVGDLDGDGRLEIVVATGEGVVACLAADGTVQWERTIGGVSPSWATSAPVVCAASDGRGRVAAASSDGQRYCLDGHGAVLWRRPTSGRPPLRFRWA